MKELKKKKHHESEGKQQKIRQLWLHELYYQLWVIWLVPFEKFDKHHLAEACTV